MRKKQTAEYQREWRRKNPEKSKEYTRRYSTKYPGRKNEAVKKWISNHSEEYKKRCRKYGLKRKYRINIDDYNNLLISQNHKCAICGMDEIENGKALAVDHNHESGKIRGLLCGSCNQGLGIFKDDIGILSKTISYLEDCNQNI